MANEQYLHVSYFAAVASGVGLAILMEIILARPHWEATEGQVLHKLGKFLRRAFPSWLILMVLLGFASVTYFDCGHTTYAEIVADRAHLTHKTQEQVFSMSICLAIALTTYAVIMVVFLWARARTQRSRPKE